MKVLVINAGSSSLKYQLIGMEDESVIAKGLCERIGMDVSVLKGKGKNGADFYFEKSMPTHVEAIKYVLDILTSKEYGVISSMNEITAVGHRVLHSGKEIKTNVVVNPEIMKILEKNVVLGPLHMPANIAGIKACIEAMPNTMNVCVFDTAFHATMPDYAALYAIPYEAYTEWSLKKYGFHGTSHQFVSDEAAKFVKKPLAQLKMVTCHLGNGSSLAAVKDGKCIDTSMGLTPLEGVPMGTRSGDIDPSAVEFIMKQSGMNISDTINYLNKKSGMLGVSGISSDFRDLCKAYDEGNERAKLALDMFNYKVKKYLGSYIAAMGGVDVIVFTGGIGENTDMVREGVAGNLECFGIKIDKAKNDKFVAGEVYKHGISVISTEDSKVKVLIVPTNEELVIARETKSFYEKA